MGTSHFIIGKDNSYNSALIRKLITQHGVQADALDTLEGKSIDLHQLNNALYTDSLIAKNRGIIINNAESLKPDVIEAVIKYSASAPEHILLLLVSENTDAIKHSKFAALNSAKTIKKHNLSNQTTYSLIQDYIKEHNVKITGAAVDMLINVFEVSTWGIIENELNKLSTYAGKNGSIDENAVSELTFNLNKSDTFKFVNELLNHTGKAAFHDLKKIKETGGESAMVIGALVWKLRQLIYNAPDDDSIRKRIGLIYDYSLAMRKGMVNSSLALDMLTIELLHGKLY
jgi:DNA polymerase III delta subunit